VASPQHSSSHVWYLLSSLQDQTPILPCSIWNDIAPQKQKNLIIRVPYKSQKNVIQSSMVS
jgi:hypothetical protein